MNVLEEVLAALFLLSLEILSPSGHIELPFSSAHRVKVDANSKMKFSNEEVSKQLFGVPNIKKLLIEKNLYQYYPD